MSQHYRLLGVTPNALSGPLAPLMNDAVAGHTRLFRILRTLSKLASGQEIELLGADCQVDQKDRFHARATGLLGRALGRRLIPEMVRLVQDSGRPILRRDDQLVFSTQQPAVPSAAAVKELVGRSICRAGGRRRASTATLQVTARCQADCFYCGDARHVFKPRPELTTGHWRSIIRQIEDLGVTRIAFTGGEPLLREDIYELISWVRKDESSVVLFTNGLQLSSENVTKLVDAGLFSLNVSIDDPDPKGHNELRKVNRCFERAVEGLQRCRDAGLVVGISTYVTSERLRSGQVAQMVRLAGEVGAHEITFYEAVPVGEFFDYDMDWSLSDEERAEFRLVEEEWNAGREHPRVVTRAHASESDGMGCYAGWCHFYMTAYGDMLPCDSTPLTVGNALRDPIHVLWNRIANHPAYSEKSGYCRMQDAEFRARYVDRIPQTGPFPFPIADLDTLPRPKDQDLPKAA